MFGWASRSGHISEADLSAYTDGMVTPGLASRIQTHIGACRECASALQELHTTKTMLAGMPRSATQRSFTLGPEFASQRPAPPRTASMRGMLTFAPALTLSILVVLLVVDLLPGGSGKSGASVTSYNADASSKAASSAGPPTTPPVLSAPAAIPPNAPAPPSGAGGVAPTPQLATARNDVGPPTPSAQSAGIVRSAGTPGTEAFNPAANPPQPTPLVSRPPLQSTSASARESGISLLHILEIVAAVCFVLSAGAFIWDKKRS
jgi:anti-sigma factor RsiW